MTYKIFITTERAGKLVYKGVKSYSEEGSFIRFKDEKTSEVKLYPILRAEIIEEKEVSEN